MTPSVVTAQRDFSSGEIDASLKRDDENPILKSGARQMRNWRILNSKKVQNRSGRRALFSDGPRVEEISMAGSTFHLCFGNGTLKVVTTNVRAGYLRKNGVPYSDNAVVTEYFDRLPGPNNTQWLIVSTTVNDPMYLNAPFTVSSNFKLEADATKWRPEACQIDPPLVPGEHRRIPFRPGDVETIR